MSLRYQSQVQVDLIPDEQTNNRFEVLMPFMSLTKGSGTDSIGFSNFTNIVSNLFQYTPMVESITFTPQAFNTGFTRVNSYYWGYPQDKQSIKNMNITLYLDVGNLAMYYLEAWKNLMFNQEYEYYYPPQRYKKDIVVLLYGLGGVSASTIYFLRGCFPIETSAFELAYSKDPKRLTVTQTFSVDRVEYSESRAFTSVLQTLVSGNALGIVSDQMLAAAQNLYYGGLSDVNSLGNQGSLLQGFGS